MRTLATLSPEFEMSTGEYSSSIHDTEYQYFHSSENVKITVPFEVKNEVAIVSAHLQASFLETGLRFYIEDEEGTVVEYGTFESSHRIETYAAPLTAGQYNIIFLETGFGPQNICNHFSAAVLIESEDQWDSYDALLRKTNDCGFADFPKSLNIIGELEEGSIHWHRKLPLDAKTQGHRFPFVLEKPSIFRLAVERVPDVVFQSRLALVTMSPYKSLVSKDPVRGIHIKLDTGSYYLDIVYGSASELPKVIECEEFEIDLQIVPEDVYTQLAEMSTCATPLPLPAVLKKPGEVKAHLITDAPIDTRIKLDLSISSHVRFQLSYESALTGPLTLHLYDAQNTRVAFSAGVQDYSSLATSVPAGKYMLRVLGTIVGNEFERVCAKISFWYFNEETELAAEECEGAELPEKLYTEETRPFGGPQEKDGSLSFYGVFRFPETKKAEKVYLRVGETSIARVLSMTSASGTSVEIMLYSDTRMTKVLGFSKNAGRAGSFILSLEAKYEPYVMELTYSKHTSQSKCPTFELAIEVERKEAVREKLTCDQALKVRSLLPDMRASLSGKETKGGENFTIRSEWLIGDSKNFPQGVTSPGTKNSKFSYEMQIDIKSPGRFSVTTEFDFLTNDIYLKLQKGDQVLGHSQWEVLGDQLGENLELASILEDIPVEAGVYTLVLKQAVAANHLVQIFSGVPLCFYFSFSMEFEAIAMEVIDEEDKVNKLVDVIPNDKFDINPSKGLAILMTWEHPFVKGKNGSFLKAFALENEKLAKVHPNSIRQEKAKPQKLEITFKPGQLPLGSCFMLKLDVTHLDLSSDDIPPEFDFFGAHQYCTGNCACNPKAEAKCNSEMECVCPSPYTGVTCEECIDGYTFEESKICIKDECANCPDACVNGKCQAAPPCQCGDYGECVKNKCKCKTGYTGEKCDSCEDGELVFPDCAPCGYDLLPVNITYSENMDKGKNGLNRKGEFQFSAERVEKKTQSISFRLQKGSMVQIDITDSLKDTKVLIADFTRKPIKPLSDETNESVRSAKWYLQGGRQYSMVIVGKARQRCAAFAVDISITPSDPPAELPKVKKEEQVTEKSSTSEQSSLRSSEATDCQGHGRRRADGSCACDVGYIGSSCGKCDDGFEMRPSGACLQKVAPPISLQNVVTAPPRVKYIQPETNWTTTIVGLCVCVICFYAVYRIYQAKSSGEQRWHHRPLNTSGFDGPEDEDEEERRSLHERSRRRAQDPTL